MATTNVKDYHHYDTLRRTAEQRKVQDQHLAGLHRRFDLEAQDNHMKYERPSFAVVTASEAFRKGYDEINWSQPGPVAVEPKKELPWAS